MPYRVLMKRIGKAALIASTIGPVQSILGWVISGSLWPGYDPIRQTISDLAADDSPVQAIQTSFFFLGATLTVIGALSARTLALPGRIVLLLAGLATYALAIFTTPSQTGHSDLHRLSASISFVLMSAWPLFAMRFRKDAPWVIRPVAAISATVGLAVISIWFLLTWLDPTATNIGVAERVIVTAQVLWLSFTVWVCWLIQKRADRAL
ncbi:MAG: hypothetical protein RL036_254 [Actinomycetota bacterium]|jgi:hypothetical membrane protein